MNTEKKSKAFNLTIISMMVAITFVLMNTPLGTISFGAVSITIAYIPILIITIILGLKSGLAVALAFGIFSLLKAAIAPQGVLDPLFVNPLLSILPRLFIPVTTYFVYKLFSKINNVVGIILATIVGNLTNTILVYVAMFLIFREKVEILMGKDFKTVILGLISVSTAIKTVLVVIITLPIVLGLQTYLKKNRS